MDDDIVFLGTSRPTIPLPKARPSVCPVTGITLHVEKNGDVAAHRLTFRRATTTVVHVGRRSASDAAGDDCSSGSDAAASFRCAVVSRRHAKVAFSDSGHAYLIDLGSHHGTHVRSPADRSARALIPETPTLLVDGDLITFGKPVGKGDESVRPIVARVELVYTPVLANATDGSITNSSRPTTPSAPHAFSVSSSGRYGIPVGISPFSSSASSSSSDAEGESVDHDSFSDIEEIPPPSHSATQTQPPMQSQRESQPQVQSQTPPQGQSSFPSSWSIHPAPPIPYIFGKVANTLRVQPRNVPLRDSVYTSSWFSNRSQNDHLTKDQQPQQPTNESATGDDEQGKQAGGVQLCDPSRITEDLFQRQERLRDALGRRRVQQQVQEGMQPAVPSSTGALEATVISDTCTPSAPISAKASVNLGASSPAPTPVSLVVNRLPSMTALIERPLNHFGFAQLSQFFLGGLGTDKAKMVTNSEKDADVEMSNAVSANLSLPAAAEPQEPTPTSETVQNHAVKSNPIKELGAEAPGVDVHPSSTPLSVHECAPTAPTTMPLRPLPHWTEDFRPPPVPMPHCRLPSIANALSPGPANVNAHVHGPAYNTWVPPPSWCSPPAPHALAAVGSYHLPPTHSPETPGTWYWNDSMWEACNFAGPMEGNSRIDGMRHQAQQACAHILAPIANPEIFSPVSAEKASGQGEVWRSVDYFPIPATVVDAGAVDGARGTAQSPPPAPRIPAPASPGLSYASSREASPVLNNTEGRQHERERSEPMELASRSPSPALPQRVDKGKRRMIQFSINISDDEDEDGAMDWDGDGDDDSDSDEDSMDLELEAELASYAEDKVVPGHGNLHLLTFMRDKAAAREAEIARDQEREREKERERQKEWAEAVEEREELRREIEREERKDAEMRSAQWTAKKLEGDFNTFRTLTNAKLADHTSQLTAFDGRIREVDAECGVLCVRVESLSERCEVAQIDVASVNATLDNILESGEGQRAHKEGEDDAAMAERETVKAGVSDVRALIDEMKALHTSTQAQAKEELQTLRALRTEAEAAYAALTQQMREQAQKSQVQTQVRRPSSPTAPGRAADDAAPQPPVLPSLKRKRDDSDEDEAAPDGDDERDRGAEGSSGGMNANEYPAHELADDVVMDALPLLLATSTPSLSTFFERGTTPPPRKRARKIARFVVRTATAVSVGAVVTWTALAFS